MKGALGKRFGAVLRELRTAMGLSQEALAHECDFDRTYISMLERGVRQPSLETVFRVGKVLKTSPSEIVARVERLTK